MTDHFHSMRIVLLSMLFTFSAGNHAANTTYETVTPKEHIRTADQTFLTIPEWFLVFSPVEYGAYIESNRPSTFPYFMHIKQFWQSYNAVYQRIKNEFSLNGEYHIMVMVIGISTTVEYALKGTYELSIGRLFESTKTHGQTQEDAFAAMVANDYAEFIYEQPWYKYDFREKLKQLWSETNFFGPDMLRKIERKYVLSSEYAIKALYAGLIGYGTSTSFEAPIHNTAVVTEKTADEALLLPRYQPFTGAALSMAAQGANFTEIAGNHGKIALALWAEQSWDPDDIESQMLFSQPIITQPGSTRFMVEVDIVNLGSALRYLQNNEMFVEHIYDY